MAFTISQLPTNNYLLARSPLIVVAGDATVTDSTYRVVVKVYAWEGDQSSVPADPIVTLDKGQDDEGRAKFNIGPILEDLFTPNDPANYLITNVSTGMIYNLVMEIGYTNSSAFVLESTTTVRKVVEGYGIFPQTINQSTDTPDILVSRKFMTARPTTMYAIKGQPMWFYAFYQGSAIADSEGFYWAGGGASTNVQFTTLVPTDPPVESQEFMLRQQSTSTFLEANGHDTNHPINISLGSVRYDTRTINFLDELCGIGSDTICFVNRFGVWDWLHVYAVQRKGVNVDRITYNKRISRYGKGSDAVTYDTFNASKAVLRSKATRTYEVNTGWITEAHNELIQDMFLSKDWFSLNLDVALYLTDQEVQFKKDSDVDLINYTFRFEVASNLIQDIQ